MVSINSVIAVLIRPGEFKVQTVLKVLRASQARSACFLREDSDGMVEIFEGVMSMRTLETNRTQL